MRLCGHVPEVSVEEFVEGEEFTYDTVRRRRAAVRERRAVPAAAARRAQQRAGSRRSS
ncbi:MAG: hypothetical protein R3F59_23340 [Myxococcota bacterium]